MTESFYFTDPGAILGKTVVKIGQVLLALLVIGALYMAFLASEGLFSGWGIEIDSDFQEIFSFRDTDQLLVFLFVGLGLKFLFWLGLLTWIGRKI